MESCSSRADAGPDKSGKTAIVGLGNPFHGDDGVGPVVAQRVFDVLHEQANVDLLDPAPSAVRLSESLFGYHRALIIDALIDAHTEVGKVVRVDVFEHPSGSLLSFHTAGFHDILTLARMAGLDVPRTIVMYGIAIREPENFSESLSAKLTARLPQIVKVITADVLREDRKSPRCA